MAGEAPEVGRDDPLALSPQPHLFRRRHVRFCQVPEPNWANLPVAVMRQIRVLAPKTECAFSRLLADLGGNRREILEIEFGRRADRGLDGIFSSDDPRPALRDVVDGASSSFVFDSTTAWVFTVDRRKRRRSGSSSCSSVIFAPRLIVRFG